MTETLAPVREHDEAPRARARRGLIEHPLVQLTLVRYREFLREPEAVFWVFVFPILLAAGLGVAFRNRPADVQHIAVLSTAPGARTVAEALGHDSTLAVRALDDSAAARALRTGEVSLVIVPHGASSVTYRYDDTRPESRAARLVADAALQRAAGRTDPVAVSESRVRERGSRYIDFVIPGLLGMNLMGSGIWGIGFAIVDARKKKLLKRLVATPMSRAQYLASFLLSRLTMLILEVATLLGFGALVFGVPLRGSIAQLALICLLASLSFGALGLLVASRARTMEGASGLMNLVMLPMWVFSGVFFSSSNFPKAMQPFIQALPLTAVNDALRANMLQAAGLGAVAGELGIVLAWLVVAFLLALRMFRWK
ncbi:MAG TPA: ABC transporter permease [Gemmatimonadaceae bacterium]|nr:ABC transporter permease [Gemmatimonadaceae bacterium]